MVMEPKVMAITKKKHLSKMLLATLFGEKEQDYIFEGVDFCDTSQGEEPDEDNMEDMNLLVKKFSKSLTRNKGTKQFIKSNEASTFKQNFTCFECGKLRHVKVGCPSLVNKNPFKGKAEKKTDRAYIV
ncbi:hypothetical protein Lal_00008080, partial [Lupinus albus]